MSRSAVQSRKPAAPTVDGFTKKSAAPPAIAIHSAARRLEAWPSSNVSATRASRLSSDTSEATLRGRVPRARMARTCSRKRSTGTA